MLCYVYYTTNRHEITVYYAPRGMALSILPNRHEITVLLPNQTWKRQWFASNYSELLAKLVRDDGKLVTYYVTLARFDVIGHGI